jgi:hypothetical protein
MSTEEQVVRLSRLAGQLYADLHDITDEQQALQVIADYFEKVGEIALAGQSTGPLTCMESEPRTEARADYDSP